MKLEGKGKQAVLLDMDGVTLTRADLYSHEYTSLLAYASKKYRKMKGSQVSYRPAVTIPVYNERYDKFFFPLEVAWVRLEGSLHESKWRVAIFKLPFPPSALTRKGKWKIRYLIAEKYIPEWDVIFGEHLRIFTTISYRELIQELQETVTCIKYKGGCIERYLAESIHIASCNVECYGVPKLDSSYPWISAPFRGMICQLHKDRKCIHCPRVEVFSIKNYLQMKNVI